MFKTKVDYLGKFNQSTEGDLIIFASPAISQEMTDLVTKYSLKNNVRISLNFVKESELWSTIADMEDKKISIGLAGYEPQDRSEDSIVFLGSQKIYGVTEAELTEDKDQNHKKIKNLCQLERLAKKQNLDIYISNSYGSIRNFLDIYNKDCQLMCENMANKTVELRDVPTLEFVRNNNTQYILVSNNIVPDLLANHEFEYFEAMDLIFYLHSNLISKMEDLVINNAYDIVELINKHELGIVTYDQTSMDEVKEQIDKYCEESINNPDFRPKSISPSNFQSFKSILLGLRSEMENLGSVIYESTKKEEIWFYCHNQIEEGSYQNFKKFLVRNKFKSVKKYS